MGTLSRLKKVDGWVRILACSVFFCWIAAVDNTPLTVSRTILGFGLGVAFVGYMYSYFIHECVDKDPLGLGLTVGKLGGKVEVGTPLYGNIEFSPPPASED